VGGTIDELSLVKVSSVFQVFEAKFLYPLKARMHAFNLGSINIPAQAPHGNDYSEPQLVIFPG
jgi:hypothetical protein